MHGVFFALFALLLAAMQPAFAERHAPTVRVGYYENGTFQAGADRGAIRQGYAYEYYRKISEYTGWQYEYVYGGFAELYQMLVDGHIDLLAGLAKKKNASASSATPISPWAAKPTT